MIFPRIAMKNPTASCGVSSKEKAFADVATPLPCLPFIPAANYRVFWLIPIIAIFVLASACNTAPGEITVSSPWTRSGLEGENSAVYFEITGGSYPDTLLSASSEVASEVMIHKSIMDEEGTMRMEHQENVPIPAGEIVKFEPGGFHIMLIGLHQDFAMGELIELKLLFEKTGEVIIHAPVKNP
ncbi:MAG: copper chaperone PCu(A)C [Anaerolineales bacterium]